MKFIFFLVLLITQMAAAQTRIIVPFPAGGGTDLVCRMILKDVSEKTGKQFIIENVSGAGGDIGRQKAIRDNILLFTPNSIIISAYLDNNSYVPLQEFKSVVGIGSYPYLLSGHPSLAIKNITELKDITKKHGAINISSAGVVGANTLIIEQLGKVLKIPVVVIPHRGTPDALLTTISGNTPLMVSGIQGTEEFIKSKKLIAIAVTTDFRDVVMKDVPTIQEMIKTKFNYPGWFGIVAPKKYDDKQIEELSTNVIMSLKTQTLKEKLTEMSVSIWGYSPNKFTEFLTQDDKRWQKTIKESKQ